MVFFGVSGGSWICLEILKLAWGARGSEFESRHADHLFITKSTGYSLTVVARFCFAAFLCKLFLLIKFAGQQFP